MSADSKEPRLRSGVPLDIAPAERRDTLRGVGDPTAPDPASTLTPEEERRLKQEEFTVPPQLWRRPPSGWFRQFARAAEPAAAAEPKPAEGGATLESPAEHQGAQSPSKSTRWLPLALIALGALALFAGWRLLRSPAPTVDPAETVTARAPEPPAAAVPTTTELSPAPAAPSIAPAPPPSAETPRPIKRPIGASAPSSAAAPSAPPSSAHGPIY